MRFITVPSVQILISSCGPTKQLLLNEKVWKKKKKQNIEVSKLAKSALQ